MIPEKRPAVKFPTTDDKKNTAIIMEANRLGESLFTTDNPTGEIASSPQV